MNRVIYVEYFDEEATNNVCAFLVDEPEQVIFIGGNSGRMKKAIEKYRIVAEGRGLGTKMTYLAVNVNRLDVIVRVLSDIVENNTGADGMCNCVFDLTGGNDLVLVAMGIVYNKYADRHIQMQRFNVPGGTVLDCDADGRRFSTAVPSLTVEENIRIHGGDIVYRGQKPGGTRRWRIDEDFLQDIDSIWDVCRRDVKKWNHQINLLETAEKMRIVGDSYDPEYDHLLVEANIDAMTAHLGRRSRDELDSFDSVVTGLRQCGVLTEYSSDGVDLRIRYKNDQVRHCLTKAGQALEMKIYSTALRVRDREGKPVYNDVMTGVTIDWDGELFHPKGSRVRDTENEIDVIMMHGAIPVFVSCKNGIVTMEELYKLNVVAERFGGEYSRRVLVANAIDDRLSGEYLRQRASDMKIRIVENMQNMTDEELCRTIANLWQS